VQFELFSLFDRLSKIYIYNLLTVGVSDVVEKNGNQIFIDPYVQPTNSFKKKVARFRRLSVSIHVYNEYIYIYVCVYLVYFRQLRNTAFKIFLYFPTQMGESKFLFWPSTVVPLVIQGL
jgi:hypothetical protein